jgi:YD repeat-containing protein
MPRLATPQDPNGGGAAESSRAGAHVLPAGALLDPAAWQEGLEKYAQAMHLAVALTDAQGHSLGPCLNPQPLWSLLRVRQPAQDGECPFALACLKPCTCVADALKSRRVVRTRDRTGLVHFTVPLLLDGQTLGALVAGQVFDHYPEQLPLEQVAGQLGLSPAKVWEKARLEHPVSPTMLRIYEELLGTLGEAYLRNRYHTLLEENHRLERERAAHALRQAYDELERRVEERTADLKEAQKKALQAERLAAIGEMVAGLAHESRNVLQRSEGCLERLTWRLQDQPEALDLLARVQHAHADLRHLFEDVRAYAGPVHLDVMGCSLADVWREAWAELAEQRAGRDAQLHEEIDPEPECHADTFRLQQVFRNIFDNSLAACADPVRIEVCCTPATLAGRPAWSVSVHDNGPGLTPEQGAKIFEPFYTTKPKGTGLGMAIARRIIEAHGGLVQVGDGRRPGAEIVITLPARIP